MNKFYNSGLGMFNFLKVFTLTIFFSNYANALPDQNYYTKNVSIFADAICLSSELFDNGNEVIDRTCASRPEANLKTTNARDFCNEDVLREVRLDCELTLLELNKNLIKEKVKLLKDNLKERAEYLIKEADLFSDRICAFNQEQIERKSMWSATRLAEEYTNCNLNLQEMILDSLDLATSS